MLVVDDNCINRTLASGFLEIWQIETVLATDGTEAQCLVEEGRRFDPVLMELQVPIMDGIVVTVKIRHSRKSASCLHRAGYRFWRTRPKLLDPATCSCDNSDSTTCFISLSVRTSSNPCVEMVSATDTAIAMGCLRTGERCKRLAALRERPLLAAWGGTLAK